MTEAQTLAEQLINIESITPNDNGCQQIIADYLTPLGFDITPLNKNSVNNLWARFGDTDPLFMFAGHTDVVPPGAIDAWSHPPFQASVKHNKLYGRGAADMKAAIACMLSATKNFVQKHPSFKGSIAFAITSDEEGEALDGSKHIVEYLQQQHINPTYCLIGEASSSEQLGDAIKIGRRGSLHGHLSIHGTQGHIAYPKLANNPIHQCLKALDQLCHHPWQDSDEYFQASSLQISNIHAGEHTYNVIPADVIIDFNIRFSAKNSAQQIQQTILQILNQHQLKFTIEWKESSTPFLSEPKTLAAACINSIAKVCQQACTANTFGGSSDGRFFNALECEIVELGFINQSIHKIDEHVNVNDIERLTQLYQHILHRLLI